MQIKSSARQKMEIYFNGTSNTRKAMLNGVVLIMKDGKEVFLDRDNTESLYEEQTGKIRITFVTPYIWDGKEDYDGSRILDCIDSARYFLADIEDDASEDYCLTLKELSYTDNSGKEYSLKHSTTAADYLEYLKQQEKDKQKAEADMPYPVKYTIMQIKEDAKHRHEISFTNLKMLAKMGYSVERDNYKVVYNAVKGFDSTVSDEIVLEELFYIFNMSRPGDFKGHSLSVSDIVILERNGEKVAYFCDSFGWSRLFDFLTKKEACCA